MGLPYDTSRCAKTDASYHCQMKRHCLRYTDKGRAEVDAAVRALAEGDVLAMVQLYASMKENDL